MGFQVLKMVTACRHHSNISVAPGSRSGVGGGLACIPGANTGLTEIFCKLRRCQSDTHGAETAFQGRSLIFSQAVVLGTRVSGSARQGARQPMSHTIPRVHSDTLQCPSLLSCDEQQVRCIKHNFDLPYFLISIST